MEHTIYSKKNVEMNKMVTNKTEILLTKHIIKQITNCTN